MLAGKNGFRAEVGAWSTLGQESLVLGDDEYVPDFTAYVDLSELRYLGIVKTKTSSAHLSALVDAPRWRHLALKS